MRKNFITLLVLPLSLLGLLHAVAMADGGAAAMPANILSPISPWTALIATALAVGANFLRKFTDDTGFAHTPKGAALIAAGCSVLTFVGDAIQAHGLHGSSVIIGLGGGLAALLSMSKPEGTSKGQSGFAELRIVAGIAICIVTGYLLFGCGPVSRAYAVAYGACMEGKGFKVAGTVPDRVNSILGSADSEQAALQNLEAIGTGALADATTCAVQAWLAVNPLPKNASPSPRLLAGRAAGNAYLARHPLGAYLLTPPYRLVLTDHDLLSPTYKHDAPTERFKCAPWVDSDGVQHGAVVCGSTGR